MATNWDVVVVGGGIAGLVTGLELKKRGLKALVLEASGQPGGYLAQNEFTYANKTLAFDVGAESFASRDQRSQEYFRELGLELTDPNPLGAWHFSTKTTHRGEPKAVARPLPKTAVLGIPASLFRWDVLRSIGLAGVLRASQDYVRPLKDSDLEADLATLVRNRLGQRALDHLVFPVTSGVFSTSPAQLHLASLHPPLAQQLQERKSLLRAAAQLTASAQKAGSAVHGINGGIFTAVDRMASELHENQSLSLRTKVTALSFDSSTKLWSIQTKRRTFQAPKLVLSTPFQVSTKLLSLDIPGGQGTDIALLTCLVKSARLNSFPRGSGLLVSADASVGAKASTHSNAKWPWLDAQIRELWGPDLHLIRLSYGRKDASANTFSDRELELQAVRDLATLYGLKGKDFTILNTQVTRWPNALPPFSSDYRKVVTELRTQVANLPVYLVGSWVAGSGIVATLNNALKVCQEITQEVR